MSVELATEKVAGSNIGRSIRFQVTTLGKLFTHARTRARAHAHTHVPLSQSSIIWYRSRGGDALRLGR